MLDKKRIENFIREIINPLIEIKKAKLWNMDTDILNQQKRLWKELRRLGILELEDKIEIEIRSEGLNKKNNKSYNAYFKGNLIKFYKQHIQNIAESTMSQMLRFSSAFNYISYDHYNPEKNFKKGIEEDGESIKYTILNNLVGTIQKGKMDWDEIARLIKNCFFSKAKDKNNILISLIIVLIYKSKYWNEFKFSDCIILPIQKASKKDGKGSIIILEEEGEEYLEKKVYKQTYKTFIEEIEQNIGIDNCVEEIITLLFQLKGVEKICDDWEKNKEIAKLRAQLRPELIRARRLNENQEYSDIEGEGIEKENLKFLDAAHIWEVRQIRTEEDMDNSDLCNPNNGLLISKKLHKALDSEIIQLSLNGEIRFNEADYEQIKEQFGNSLKIEGARIKEDVFNEEMKEYIRKRYNI